MDDVPKDYVNNLLRDTLGVNIKDNIEENNDNSITFKVDKSTIDSMNKPSSKHYEYKPEDKSSFKKSHMSPKGYMYPDEDMGVDEFMKIFDDNYKDKLDLYRRIHVVKEAFLEVFNNCIDIYFRQVKHKYGTSAVIFVPQKYVGHKCTIILWPKEGDEPKIQNVRDVMLKVQEVKNANS